jgi:hypothetical protein
MAIIRRGGRDGKVCSTCRRWKPLENSPTDPSHGPTQGRRHCRCKACHPAAAKIRPERAAR